MARRAFGSVRKLPSGKYQARYKGADGLTHTSPTTYTRKADAEAFLATIQSDIVRGSWKAPKTVRTTLDQYADTWISHRSLKPHVRDQYFADFRNHISNRIGHFTLPELTPAIIREWHANLTEDLRKAGEGRGHRSPSRRTDGAATVSRCYRILKAILNSAVEDELLPANPCRIKGASTYQHPERPTLSIDEVEELATTVPDRYRALVYLLAWGAVRLGEATALIRSDVDLKKASVRVARDVYPQGNGYIEDTTKSAAGQRTIVLPQFVMDEIAQHMREFTQPGKDSLLFPTRSNRVAYGAAQTAITRALDALGRSDVSVHDLRHTGQLLAAQAGATIADLQQRLGHSTANAAMRYAHADAKHQRVVMERMAEHRDNVVELKRRAV